MLQGQVQRPRVGSGHPFESMLKSIGNSCEKTGPLFLLARTALGMRFGLLAFALMGPGFGGQQI